MHTVGAKVVLCWESYTLARSGSNLKHDNCKNAKNTRKRRDVEARRTCIRR